MGKKVILILCGILLLGFIIRAYRMGQVSMYGDELTMVYDGYSISKTGMDSTGTKLPLTFRMGSGRPGGYIYFSLPFVYLFGPTVWGERSLSLLSGLGIIVLMYFIGKKLFGEKVGLVGAFLTAVSPWDIYLSRAGFEAHFALFLAILGITFFLYKKYLPWALAWGVATLTYPTFKLTLPILFLVLVWFTGYKKLVAKKAFLAGLLILAVFAAVLVREDLFSGSEQRFFSQNIFADQKIRESIIQKVNYERTISTMPGVLRPIFINREMEYAKLIFGNYVNNLSPDFLILRGDQNPRHNPGEMGMIYIVDLPLILVGLAFLWQKEKDKFILLLKWVLITPLATMFFPETHALRNDLMLPALLLIIAFALTKIDRKYVYVATALIFIQLVYLLAHVYFVAPAKFAGFWSAEAKTVALEAIAKSQTGEQVVLSTKKVGDIEYAYEVYGKVDPRLAISQFGKFPKKFGNVTMLDN